MSLGSISAKLTTWFALSTFALLVVTSAYLNSELEKTFDEGIDDYLEERTNFVSRLLSESSSGETLLRRELESENPSRRFARVFLRILDGNEKTIVEAAGMSKVLPLDSFPSAQSGERDFVGSDLQGAEGKSFRAMTVRVKPSSGGEERVLQIALDRSRELGILQTYRYNQMVVIGSLLVVCLLVGYGIAHRCIRPVRQISEAATRIRSSTLHERLNAVTLPTELQDVATTINAMLDRLEESFQRISQFSADIAHELRTPLNNLRGETEVALGKSRTPQEYREVLGSVLEECERLSRLVDRLLFLARSERADLKVELQEVDIGEELKTVGEFYEAAASEANVELSVSAPPKIVAPVNRELFQSAVGNLISNAIRHTPKFGRVRVTAHGDENSVQVNVTDNGCGIASDHLPHLFDRFYRVDGARSGASGGVGLGLAIVQTIARLHNASVNISSEIDHGTTVTMKFQKNRK